MSGARRAPGPTAALAALLLLLLASGPADAAFSRLEAGARCADYLIPDVASKDECFNTAAAAAGISPLMKMQINGIGFTGCGFNTVANILIYSETPAATPATHVILPTLQYVCNGVPTTTTTTTATASTATTSTTSPNFAKLGPGSRCADEGVPEVPSKEACFKTAGSLTGLGGTSTLEINNVGFTGCVYNIAADMLLWGVTAGVSAETNLKLPSWEYLCNGIPTTTVTTTTTATTTTIVYTKLPAGQRCGSPLPAVASKEACFGGAASAAGLAGRFKIEVNFMGFTGCVYNAIAGVLMYGVTPAAPPSASLALPHFEYICIGAAPTLYP